MADAPEPDQLRLALISLRRAVLVLTLAVIAQCTLQLAPLAAPLFTRSPEKKPTPAASAPVASKLTSTKASGGPMFLPLGYGFGLNKGSTLNREWITLQDPAMPADLEEATGLKVVFSRDDSASYRYTASFRLHVKEALSAAMVVFMTFDFWGTQVQPHVFSEVTDLEPGHHDHSAAWRLSENEATQFYASIAYVAKVRTRDGRIVEADAPAIAAEVKRFSERFAASRPSAAVKPSSAAPSKVGG